MRLAGVSPEGCLGTDGSTSFQAGLIEIGQQAWTCRHALRNGDGAGELIIGQVPNGGTADAPVPASFERRVEANAHEAVIEPDRPRVNRRHGGEDVAGQRLPARQKFRTRWSVSDRHYQP